MATEVAGAAERNVRRRLVLGAVIAAQVAVPAVALLHRITEGVLSIPWGWQMYS